MQMLPLSYVHTSESQQQFISHWWAIRLHVHEQSNFTHWESMHSQPGGGATGLLGASSMVGTRLQSGAFAWTGFTVANP